MRSCHGFLFLAFFIGDILQNCNAVKCFQCSSVPFPRDCAKISTCGPHEYCHVEQYVTTDGTVLYNSGCMAKQRCGDTALLIGRRADNMTERRSTDVTTCLQCCDTEFCNNKGCGATDVPSSLRGPYCYTCHSTADPTKCNQVSICAMHEVCLLVAPLDLSGLPETVYRGQCQSKVSCDVIATTDRNLNCPAHCCDQDFCNDHCGTFSNITMTTPKPATTRDPLTTASPTFTSTNTSPPPTTATNASPTFTSASQPRPPTTATINMHTTPEYASVPICKTGHYYDDITGMCIRLFETNTVTFADAETACEAIGDRLAAPDSIEKTVFIENTILHHSSIGQTGQRNYWIGAFDKHNNSQFLWPNGHIITYTNWGGGDEVIHDQQPDDIKEKNQDCVLLYGRDGYRWLDDHCWSKWYFICEDHRTLKDTSSSNNNCKSGHYYDEVTGMCIMLGESTRMNHNDASKTCRHLGDTLATVDSHEKTIFVENVLLHHSTIDDVLDRNYYIGLTVNHHNYQWPNQQPFLYTNWGGGDEKYSNQQPDGGKDICAMIFGDDHYQWHDIQCNERKYYICEDTDTLKPT